jgi:hypothetical protein
MYSRRARYVRNITLWAMAGCLRFQKQEIDGTVLFYPRSGKRKLVRIAVEYGTQLAIVAIPNDWDRYFANLAFLAVAISDRVFVGGGARAGVELILCLLESEGFCRMSRYRSSTIIGRLGQGILKQDTNHLCRSMRKYFIRPPGP